jgi:hypothetical protein
MKCSACDPTCELDCGKEPVFTKIEAKGSKQYRPYDETAKRGRKQFKRKRGGKRY